MRIVAGVVSDQDEMLNVSVQVGESVLSELLALRVGRVLVGIPRQRTLRLRALIRALQSLVGNAESGRIPRSVQQDGSEIVETDLSDVAHGPGIVLTELNASDLNVDVASVVRVANVDLEVVTVDLEVVTRVTAQADNGSMTDETVNMVSEGLVTPTAQRMRVRTLGHNLAVTAVLAVTTVGVGLLDVLTTVLMVGRSDVTTGLEAVLM